MTRRKLFATTLVGLGAVLASAAAGCASPGAAPTAGATATSAAAPAVTATAATAPTRAAAAKLSIMVGGMNKQIYLPNKLTEALGFFKDENLDVSLIDEPSGTDTETQVASGNVDLGSGSYDHTIDLQAAGKTITAVAILLREPGEFVMVSAKKADTIKSPKDWKGVNAGVTSLGSGTHTLMRAIAVRAGLQVSDVNYVKAGAGDTFIAAMKQGTIDVGMTTQPTVLRLIKSGVARLHLDLSQPETTRAALGGDYPFISVWGRADYIAQNRDTVQRVVNAYVKTLKWIGSHTAEDITAKLPADYSAADKESYIQALKDSMQMFSPDGRMPDGAPAFVLKTLQTFNDKLKAASIDLSKTYDPSFVDNANK